MARTRGGLCHKEPSVSTITLQTFSRVTPRGEREFLQVETDLSLLWDHSAVNRM